MATPAVSQALRVPGRLSVGATDFTAAYPHGGTALGHVQAVTFRRVEINRMIRATEYGGMVSTYVRGGVNWLCAFDIRGADGDALTAVFPNVFTGGNQSQVGLREGESATVQPGALAHDNVDVFAFTPNNSAHHGVVFYAGIPLAYQEIANDGEFGLDVGDEPEILWRVAFLATRRISDGEMVEVQLLADVTAP